MSTNKINILISFFFLKASHTFVFPSQDFPVELCIQATLQVHDVDKIP